MRCKGNKLLNYPNTNQNNIFEDISLKVEYTLNKLNISSATNLEKNKNLHTSSIPLNTFKLEPEPFNS